jgi:hypothetical protein
MCTDFWWGNLLESSNLEDEKGKENKVDLREKDYENGSWMERAPGFI